jgi:hypothetical protein
MNQEVASSEFKVCTLNTKTFANQLNYTAFSDSIKTYNIDLFTPIETGISPKTTSAELFDAFLLVFPSSLTLDLLSLTIFISVDG